MKKGTVCILTILLMGLSFVSSAVIFPASNVSLKVAGTDRTLQYASDNGYLLGAAASYSSATLIQKGQHDASQIWVNVNGNEKTLLNALSALGGLCGSGAYNAYLGPVPNPGHVATEVIFSSGLSLQSRINAGTFCISYSWATSSWSGCPASCGGSRTRTVSCQRNDGTTVTDSFCTGTKPDTTTPCSCHWSSFSGTRECRAACWMFCTWCSNNDGGGCDAYGAGATMGCVPEYRESCGFLNLGEWFTILTCRNQ